LDQSFTACVLLLAATSLFNNPSKAEGSLQEYYLPAILCIAGEYYSLQLAILSVHCGPVILLDSLIA